MSATELVYNHIGTANGYDIYTPTGKVGSTFPDTNIWLTQKITAGITNITCVTHKVVVANNSGLGWAAFDEPHPNGVIRTIFSIS